MRGVVLAIGAPMFVQKDVFVSMHDFNAPMFTIKGQ